VDIPGSVTVITGAASGIGAAAARAFAQRGGRLVLADAREEPLRVVAEELSATGAEVAWQVTDVTREQQVVAVMELATSRFGAINVVLPCAGIFRDAFTVRVKDGKVVRTMSAADFRDVIDVNLTGTFLTVREAAARMIDGGHGGVLFTVSSINKEGELGQINYAATKAALALWPKLLAGELHAQGVHGIRVVGIAPGYVETPILEGMRPDALQRVLDGVPIGRLLKADEIVALMMHVVENEAIHATTLEIAGGAIATGMPK